MTDLPLTVPDLLSLTGMTAWVYLITATVHSAQLLPSRRFLPLLAMALGAVTGASAAALSGQAIPDAVLLGIVSGALSSGVEETRKGMTEATHNVRDKMNDRRLTAKFGPLLEDVELDEFDIPETKIEETTERLSDASDTVEDRMEADARPSLAETIPGFVEAYSSRPEDLIIGPEDDDG